MAQKNLLCNVSVCNNDTARGKLGRHNDVRFSDDLLYPMEEDSSESMELDFSHERSW